MICEQSAVTKLQPSVDPLEGIVVRAKAGIVNGNIVVKLKENGKIIYELQDFTLVKPVIAFTTDAPAATEVGNTIASVRFDGSITQGSFPIATRSIVPDPGGLDLTQPFNFTKTNVKSNVPGLAELHTVSSQDDQVPANASSVQAGAMFKHAFYMGFSSKATLDQTDIKALVAKTLDDKITDQYGGSVTYNVPAAPAGIKYLYWCYPVGTTGLQGFTLNGLPFPVFDHANINVTNIHDGALIIEYVVKRSANKFGSGNLILTGS